MQQTSGRDVKQQSLSTCLVIDDDTFDRHMIKRCVGRARPNLRLYECATLTEARRFLDHGSADLILIDNRMPDGLGTEFAQELRSNSRMADSVICIETGDDVRTLDSGIAALSKDRLSTQSIWDMVSRFLKEREILRTTEKAQRVTDFGNQLGESLSPGMGRMLRTLRMARARVARRDPQMAIDELDKLEEMLLAMSEVVSAGTVTPIAPEPLS